MSKTLPTSPNLADETQRDVLSQLQKTLVDQCIKGGSLAIGTSAATAIKIANAAYCLIDGVIVKVAAAEKAFTATTHDVANGKFAAFLLSVNSSGVVTITKSDDADTLAEVEIPSLPSGEVALGLVIINPTGTGDFDATSTDLDDATVVPNAVYIDLDKPFDIDTVDLVTSLA